MNYMKFNELRQDIELYLKDNKLLQSEFAEKAGITSTTLSRFLTKPDSKPDINNVVGMIKVLNKSIDYYLADGAKKIVYYKDDPTPEKIRAIIYSDENLTAPAKEALSHLMATSYRQAVEVQETIKSHV